MGTRARPARIDGWLIAASEAFPQGIVSEADQRYWAGQMDGSRAAEADTPAHTAERVPLVQQMSVAGSKAVAAGSRVAAVVVVGSKAAAVAVS